MAAPSDDLTLRLEPVLPAPRALVFRALGDADEVARWWGPAGFTVPSLDFAPSVGRLGWTESFDMLERLLAARA
ncbi:MAG: hypothetical protein ACJ76M_09210 [Solirubrobacteraceae bacterium]|jgi:uncharacterized protein YndB with AHSA1/START domain